MSPTADDGALTITFPRTWTAGQRLAFMEDVACAVPRERWAHVGERMCTDSIDATAPERRAIFARLTARRARGVDGPDLVSILVWTGMSPARGMIPARRSRALADRPRYSWKGGDENVGWLGDRIWPLLWRIRNWLTRGR